MGPSPDTITSSAPRSLSSCAASRRRTTLIVRMPSCLARRMIMRPSSELAADCSSHSPRGTASTWRTMRIAVAGLIMNDAICSSGMSSGTGQAFSAGTTAYCDQLPPAELRAKTRWPTESTAHGRQSDRLPASARSPDLPLARPAARRGSFGCDRRAHRPVPDAGDRRESVSRRAGRKPDRPRVVTGISSGTESLAVAPPDPAARQVYPDWDEATALAVGGLRELSADDPDDPRLLALINELSASSERFKQLWNRPTWDTPKGSTTCAIQTSATYT